MKPGALFFALLMVIALPVRAQDPVIPTSDLEVVTLSTPATVGPGEPFSMQTTLSNDGPDPRGFVSIEIFYPFGQEDRSGFPRMVSASGAGWFCGTPLAGFMFVCRTGSLPVGSSTISINGLAPMRAGQFQIQARLTANAIDPHGFRPKDAFATVISNGAQADLAISATADTALSGPYSKVTLSHVVTNNPAIAGAATPTNVRVVTTHTSGFVESAGGPGWSCVPDRFVVDCTRPSLSPGESVTLNVVIRHYRTGGSFRSELSFTGAIDPVLENNKAGSLYGTVAVPAPDPKDFTKVLLPIVIGETPGAFGSLWRSELAMFNDNDVALLDVADLIYPFESGCFFPACPSPGTVFSKQTHFPFVLRLAAGTRPGALMYIRRGLAPATSFNLRIRDLSRQALTWGTEIPVVREENLRTGRIQLLNIPTDARFRQTLRIYDPDATAPSQVRVRFHAANEEVLLGEQIVTLMPEPAESFMPAGFAPYPAYAQLASFAALLPGAGATSRIRIEIEPLTPGLRYWAFVSVTNNETQHVTTITPQ